MRSWRRSVFLGLALVLSIGLMPSTGVAQIEANLSVYGEENAKGYLRPAYEALGAGLSNGLYYSAFIPQQKFYVRLEAQATVVNFGSSDRTFQAKTEPYFPTDMTVEAPTVVGSESSTSVVDPGGSGAIFIFPGGLDLSGLGLAVPQLRVGGFLNGTEALVRWIAVDLGDSDFGEIKMFGLAARHNISQYISNSPLALSGMIAYQSIGIGDDLLSGKLWNFGVQGSQSLGVAEPYVGLAVDVFSMDIEYDQTISNGPTVTQKVSYDAEASFHVTVGLALNIAFLRLNGEVNFAQKNSYTVGFAIGN